MESIFKHSKLRHQVIVIVNEGVDGTRDFLKGRTDIEFISFDTNVGICEALNKGSLLAVTDHILYINDDMYVLPDWDVVLMDEIKKVGHNRFFISSTMIEPADTGNPCVVVRDYGNSIETFGEEELLSTYKDLPKADWYGSTWPPNIIHKELWNTVGGLSMEFSPGMYSDPDLSMKLWKAGVRYFKGVAASRVYHFGTKSTGRIKKNDGKKTFQQKWGISPGDFSKFYLKRGMKWEGPLPEVSLNAVQKLKGLLKKIAR